MGKNMRYYKRSHVHYSKSAMKIIALVFMLVGVTFLAVGIGFAIHQTQLKNRCTLEVLPAPDLVRTYSSLNFHVPRSDSLSGNNRGQYVTVLNF